MFRGMNDVDSDEVLGCEEGTDRSDAPAGGKEKEGQGEKARLTLGRKFYPFTLKSIKRKVNPPVLLDGRMCKSYEAWEIVDYVDTFTGEIVPASDVEGLPDFKPTIRFGEMVLQRLGAIQKLRPEVRPFAGFVLKFRNMRRGLTPGVRTLATWFADMTGRRASDVRRYIPRLDEAGICLNDVMHPAFQIAGSKTTRRGHLGAEVTSRVVLASVLRQYRSQQDLKSFTEKEGYRILSGANLGPASNDDQLEVLAA